MEIAYENTLDDWIATELYNLDQLTPLKKYDRKQSIWIFLLVLGLFLVIGFTEDGEGFPVLLVLIFVAWMLLTFFQSKPNRHKQIYKRLQVAYGDQLKSIEDRQVRWEIGPESLNLLDWSKEIRVPWRSVDRIVFCPQYLFVHFGRTSVASLPRRQVSPEAFDAFAKRLVDVYQDAAEVMGKRAEIGDSDWRIDIEGIRERARGGFSLRRMGMVMLWGLVFVAAGEMFFLLLTFWAAFVFALAGYTLELGEGLSVVMSQLQLAGPALCGLAGVLLGLCEKLPGTRIRRG